MVVLGIITHNYLGQVIREAQEHCTLREDILICSNGVWKKATYHEST
jgi:hypothetical protein